MAGTPDAIVAHLLGRGATAAQIAAASALARPEGWLALGQSGDDGDGAVHVAVHVIWGEIQGTARYRVAGALAAPGPPGQLAAEEDGPAFSCTCPSAQRPCKHALALFLTFVRAAEAFPPDPRPAWVADWLDVRSRRARRATARPHGAPVDPAAQAKRAADREARIASGLDDLGRWLGDLVRQGLAGVESKPYAFWDGPAARLVDAQAPGLARRVRALHAVATSGPGWPERLLERLALLHLLVQAYRGAAALPEDLRAEVRQLVGWNVAQEELLASAPAVSDRWHVLGWRIEEDERLRSQRVWLGGSQSGRLALILSFAPSAAPLDVSLYPGTTVDADLVFFPGVRAQRALVKARRAVAPGVGMVAGADLLAASGAYAAALAEDPWLDDAPVLLGPVVPVRGAGGWALRDAGGRVVPVARRFAGAWTLAALAGGRPVTVFGEWNGRSVLPLGVGAEDRYVPLDA